MRMIPVLVFCMSVCWCCSASVFDGVLSSSDSCVQSCSQTFSLHTEPSEDELYACKRGCRLFSICQFVVETENLNQTQSECESACAEAYNGEEEQYACSLGCQNQLPFAQQQQEQLLAMMPRIHLLYPLTLVREMWVDMMNQAQEVFSSSLTVYLQADDGKMVVFQSEPQVHLITLRDELKDESLLAEGRSEPVYREYSSSLVQERLGVVAHDQSNFENQNDLFSCLSRSPWLPGWILTTTLIFSVLVFVWICCATVATAAHQYHPVQKLSFNGDLEFMKEQKLIPYSQSSLLVVTSLGTDDEAGPLPSKIKLNEM
ncbi:transmembrane protein 59 [Trichomycterus rosablanca]|uniref:transmembrane protein 59 n=1 Tax=Trichomycterus rosablanca TaxID=2290929 RepID=UPI002F35642C